MIQGVPKSAPCVNWIYSRNTYPTRKSNIFEKLMHILEVGSRLQKEACGNR